MVFCCAFTDRKKVPIGFDDVFCSEPGGSRPGYNSALSAERGSDPGNEILPEKLGRI